VEVSLARLLLHHSRLLQQVVGDDTTHGIRLVVELNVHVLSKTTGVVVAIGFSVAEGFQDRIALDQDVFNPGMVRG